MKIVTTVTVRSFHTDCFGHVHHARYVELLEEGRWSYMEAHPDIAASLRSQRINHAVVHIEIRYESEASLGDRISIETRVQNARHHGITMRQVMIDERTGKRLLSADVTNVFYRDKPQNRVATEDPVFKPWDDLQAVLLKKTQEEKEL